MVFENDFNEFFEEIETFNTKYMKRFQQQLEEVLKKLHNGEIRGTFETEEIDKPGVKGFIFRGRFGNEEALEPIEPLKPFRRPILPERPIAIPKKALEETREPLTDIFEEDSALKIYVELPGEEKEDIKLDIKQDKVEIRARNFYKQLELPTNNIDIDKAFSDYKNGVLKITIPKKLKIRGEDKKKTKIV
ncbi:MAG: Hsp20/alpha crystallin family protein [Candidatus Bathyarchaeota archaeon]|nr:Hsp20/alpha crystallin family protein [Candidatus Bathyarchaeota archaeon]